jgi:Flp pilus assembly protein TadD
MEPERCGTRTPARRDTRSELRDGATLLASQFWTEGRFDEALAQLLQAQALDPLSPVITMNLGRHFYSQRFEIRAAPSAREPASRQHRATNPCTFRVLI